MQCAYGPQLYKEHSRTSSMPARLRASIEATPVQVGLDILETGIRCQLWIPLRMDVNPIFHLPHYALIAPLPFDRRVACTAWLRATIHFVAIQRCLEVHKARVRIEAGVFGPVGVFTNAVLHGPRHPGVARLIGEGRVALRTWPRAALKAFKMQEALEFLKGRTSGEITVELRVERDAVLHGPTYSLVALLTGNPH